MARPLAVIAGAGPGIGLAVARRFAQEGFDLALATKDPRHLERLTADLPLAATFLCDFAEPGAAATLFAQIRANRGDPQVLVYNASESTAGPASALDGEVLAKELRVNATAALDCALEVLPAMRGAGRGTLLFTGGGLALKPQAELASASIGKAALRNLALCLAAELAPEGLHAATVTVCGFVQPGTAFDPDLVAERFWRLHLQAPGAFEAEEVIR